MVSIWAQSKLSLAGMGLWLSFKHISAASVSCGQLHLRADGDPLPPLLIFMGSVSDVCSWQFASIWTKIQCGMLCLRCALQLPVWLTICSSFLKLLCRTFPLAPNEPLEVGDGGEPPKVCHRLTIRQTSATPPGTYDVSNMWSYQLPRITNL